MSRAVSRAVSAPDLPVGVPGPEDPAGTEDVAGVAVPELGVLGVPVGIPLAGVLLGPRGGSLGAILVSLQMTLRQVSPNRDKTTRITTITPINQKMLCILSETSRGRD